MQSVFGTNRDRAGGPNFLLKMFAALLIGCALTLIAVCRAEATPLLSPPVHLPTGFPPDITNESPAPNASVNESLPNTAARIIQARMSGSGAALTYMKLDGGDETATCSSGNLGRLGNPDPNLVSCIIDASLLKPGPHTVEMKVTGTYGNKVDTWAFWVMRNYYWTWYDQQSQGAQDWLLLASPSTATNNLATGLSIGGNNMNLAGFSLSGAGAGMAGLAPGEVPPTSSIAGAYPGVIGGPVIADSLKGGKAITSQRILWNGNSFEEVPGTEAAQLSDDYYWTWYDSQSTGFSNWVLVSNPEPVGGRIVHYEISIAAVVVDSGDLNPGQTKTPSFPGKMGGPVEVKGTTSFRLGMMPYPIIASQRVVSGNGGAFNEVPGIPAKQLSDHYYWTWYDQQSQGASDWVMIANPDGNPIYYEIQIAGNTVATDNGTPIPAGGSVSPTFPGQMGGGVEVRTFADAAHTIPARSIASQRTIWGPSFEEVPGISSNQMVSKGYWTWYDQQSKGAQNWIMILNPNNYPVGYAIKIQGKTVASSAASGKIPAHGMIQPNFPGQMGGPVEVYTEDYVVTSQRVLWNGYFNEVPETMLH